MGNNLRKPVVAILGGTGKEGPGLAARFAKAGYKVIIGSRVASKAETIASRLTVEYELNNVSGMENSHAASAADISILTVVYSAHQPILEYLKQSLQGKILIDATARVDFRDPKPPDPPSAARTAQNILGDNVSVVAAFQNVPAHTLKTNIGEPLGLDVFVCCDNLDAAQTAITIIKDIGMNAYFAGGLDNANVVEGITSLLIAINKHHRIKTASISLTGI